jgi:hypothetical protein
MQGTCATSPTGASQFLVATADEQTWYFIWTDVPEGVDHVVFTYGPRVAREKPLHGVAYFPVVGTAPDLAHLTQSSPPVARAYDSSGDVVGEATLSASQVDASAGYTGQ